MNLKINRFDILLILIVLLSFLLGLISFSYFSDSNNNEAANIYYDNNLIYSLKLDEEKEIILKKEDYPKLIDDVIIEIKKEKGVRVKSEESPLNYCSIQGWVKRANYPIVCLPNHLLIVIESEKEVDYDMVIYYE